MPNQRARDEWLLPILERMLPERAIASLRDNPTECHWSAAVRAGIASDDEILAAVATCSRMRPADGLAVSVEAREQLPERLARLFGVLPLRVSDSVFDVATANPYDADCERALAFASGRTVRMSLASPLRIAERLDAVYRPQARVARIVAGIRTDHEVAILPEQHEVADGAALAEGALERPVVKLVDHIISQGIVAGASDIHLESEEEGIAVRLRVDGVLRQEMVLPRAVGIPLVSRVKIMARMDIADRLRPQGGRARVSVDGACVDLRISTLPAAHGEKVVIRILDSRGTVRSLDSLGLDARSALRLRRLLDVREGLILVTGPTGSGKTTTLYAALTQLLQRGLNIITVEDPVEYRVPGVVQVQVNDKAGLTFAAALRSILRQDPDVVLIGEIRDRETAAIAIQAALTGHLVFATLHTIDACSSIARLEDLGVDPSKVAAALKGIVAQRLLRKLCEACVVQTPAEIPSLLWDVVPAGASLAVAAGCEACGESGFRGRIAAMELLLTTPELEHAIAASAPAAQLVALARASGTRSLWTSGVDHLLAGVTSPDEVMRVLEPDALAGLLAGEGSNDGVGIATDYNHAMDDPAPRDTMPLPNTELRPVTAIRVGVVDVYVIDPSQREWRVLALQRATGTRCPGAWEAVHGNITDGETPEEAALRELREETGLTAKRLYNVTVHAFYLHRVATVELAVVFAAFVDSRAAVQPGSEHARYEWLSPEAAAERYLWPRARQALHEIRSMLAAGDAGAAEDVLRVR